MTLEVKEAGWLEDKSLMFYELTQESEREGVIFWIQYSKWHSAVDIVDLSDVLIWMVTCFLDDIWNCIYACAFATGEMCVWVRLNNSSTLCVSATRAFIIDVLWCCTHDTDSMKTLGTHVHPYIHSHSIKSNVLSCFVLFSRVNRWEISNFCTCLAFMMFLFEGQMSVQSWKDSMYA